jgi:hypothetical protein
MAARLLHFSYNLLDYHVNLLFSQRRGFVKQHIQMSEQTQQKSCQFHLHSVFAKFNH